MSCLNCGSNINEGENFCRKCGTKVINNQPEGMTNSWNVLPGSAPVNTVPNAVPNQTVNVVQPVMQSSAPVNTVPNVNYTYSGSINNEDLVDAYIGTNVDKMRGGGFSVSTFFFGALYALHRKMWLLGITWILGVIIVNLFLSDYSKIITFAVNIIFCLKFNNFYVNNAYDKVEKIKYNNPNANQDELLKICRKKGGVTWLPVIIAIVLYILSVFSTVLLVMFNMVDSQKQADGYYDRLTESKNMELGELKFEIPSGFNDMGNSIIINYSMGIVSQKCTLEVYSYSANHSGNAYFGENQSLKKMTINDELWFYTVDDNGYSIVQEYSIEKNEKIYYVKYEINDRQSEECQNNKTQFINSLRFD